MANEEKPSIYYDRDAIGSSEELDEYGVWVKSEPQDLSFVPEDIPAVEEEPVEAAEESEFPDMTDFPDFGDLSAEQDEASDNSEISKLFEDSELSESEGLDAESLPNFNDDDFAAPDGQPDIPIEDDLSEDTPKAIEEEKPSAEEEFSLSDVDFETETPAPQEDEEPAFPEIEEAEPEVEEPDVISLNLSGVTGEDESAPAPEAAPMQAAPMQAAPMQAAPMQAAPAQAAPDLSTQLLMRIAEELSSIRAELSTLKQEFSGLREREIPPPPVVEEKAGGFFSEEEDEKIALTGDELDNILNTAEFTEEAGSDAAEEPAAVEPAAEEEAVLETAEEEETGLEAVEMEEIDIGESFSEQLPAESPGEESVQENELDLADMDISLEELEKLQIDEPDELLQMMGEGVTHLSPALPPEDASYLEGDPIAPAEEGIAEMEEIDVVNPEEFVVPFDDESSLNLPEKVFEETDLSGDIAAEETAEENPVTDTSLDDISIDLDLEEENFLDIGETDELSLPTEEEIVIEEPLISIDEEEQAEDAAPESAEEEISGFEDMDDLALIPEGFTLESVEETSTEETVEEDASADAEEAPAVEEIPDFAPFESLEEPEIPASLESLEDETEKTPAPAPVEGKEAEEEEQEAIPNHLKQELKTVLAYMDQLLESLPDEKIEEFARSTYFDTYKKLFQELGLAQ